MGITLVVSSCVSFSLTVYILFYVVFSNRLTGNREVSNSYFFWILNILINGTTIKIKIVGHNDTDCPLLDYHLFCNRL